MSEGTVIDVILILVIVLGVCLVLAWFDYLFGYKFRNSKDLDEDD